MTLSVAEAESTAGVMIVQDMLYIYHLLKSLELEVKLPMDLEMDNTGGVDLANNWSVGGRMHHVDIRNYFLRELKEQVLLIIKHVPGELNDADIFTKNVSGPVFNQHKQSYI